MWGGGPGHSNSVGEDRDTGRSRGFAFVEMSSQEEATSAIEQFNGKGNRWSRPEGQ